MANSYQYNNQTRFLPENTNQVTQQIEIQTDVVENKTVASISKSDKELVRIENLCIKRKHVVKINSPIIKSQKNEEISLLKSIFPAFDAIDIDNQYSFFTQPLTYSMQIKTIENIVGNIHKTLNDETQIELKKSETKKEPDINQIGYWQTVHSIESKQGKLLYRPRNKSRNCTYTTGPCGHHQLTVRALKDIGCKSLQCRKDRLDYNKSLSLSKKLLVLNEKRLKKMELQNLKTIKNI